MKQTKPKPSKLAKGAESLRAYLEKTGDSVSSVCEGGGFFWSLTRSGVPLEREAVEELRGRGMLEPLGQVIDAALPACLLLKEEAKAGTACGATSIAKCAKGGFCIDCAPRPMVEQIRAGESHLPKRWHGAKP